MGWFFSTLKVLFFLCLLISVVTIAVYVALNRRRLFSSSSAERPLLPHPDYDDRDTELEPLGRASGRGASSSFNEPHRAFGHGGGYGMSGSGRGERQQQRRDHSPPPRGRVRGGFPEDRGVDEDDFSDNLLYPDEEARIRLLTDSHSKTSKTRNPRTRPRGRETSGSATPEEDVRSPSPRSELRDSTDEVVRALQEMDVDTNPIPVRPPTVTSERGSESEEPVRDPDTKADPISEVPGEGHETSVGVPVEDPLLVDDVLDDSQSDEEEEGEDVFQDALSVYDVKVNQ